MRLIDADALFESIRFDREAAKTECGYTWRTKDGREVYLRISVTEANK